jgi:hypothetical protein
MPMKNESEIVEVKMEKAESKKVIEGGKKERKLKGKV